MIGHPDDLGEEGRRDRGEQPGDRKPREGCGGGGEEHGADLGRHRKALQRDAAGAARGLRGQQHRGNGEYQQRDVHQERQQQRVRRVLDQRPGHQWAAAQPTDVDHGGHGGRPVTPLGGHRFNDRRRRRSGEQPCRQSGQQATHQQQRDVVGEQEHRRAGQREGQTGQQHRPAAEDIGPAAGDQQCGEHAEGVHREHHRRGEHREVHPFAVERVHRGRHGRPEHGDGEGVGQGGEREPAAGVHECEQRRRRSR